MNDLKTIQGLFSGKIVRQTYSNWRNDRTIRLGAGLAYYGLFALVPMAILMIALAVVVFSTNVMQTFVHSTIIDLLGDEISGSIKESANIIGQTISSIKLSNLGIIGIISLIFSSSFIFLAMQDALDVIWHNPVRKGWRKSIRRYALAYLVVLLASSLLFVALLINSISSLAKYLVPGDNNILEGLADLIITTGSWIIGILLLALIFKLLIYTKLSWKVLLLSSSITVILIVLGTWLLGIYISKFATNSLTGALSGIFLVLVWIYYEAQILLIGAQLTKVIAANVDKIDIPKH